MNRLSHPPFLPYICRFSLPFLFLIIFFPFWRFSFPFRDPTELLTLDKELGKGYSFHFFRHCCVLLLSFVFPFLFHFFSLSFPSFPLLFRSQLSFCLLFLELRVPFGKRLRRTGRSLRSKWSPCPIRRCSRWSKRSKRCKKSNTQIP